MDGLTNMNHIFEYQYSYTSDKDEFYANVTGIGGLLVYEIVDTEQMIKILKSGEMEHIDDVEGLKEMLIHDKLLPVGSNLKNKGQLK